MEPRSPTLQVDSFTSWATRKTYNIVDGGASQEEDGKCSWIHWASEVSVIICVCGFPIHCWLSESEVWQTGHVKRLWMLGEQLGECKLEGLAYFFYERQESECFKLCAPLRLHCNSSTQLQQLKSSLDSMPTSGCGRVPIKLYLQKRVVGLSWSLGCLLPTSAINGDLKACSRPLRNIRTYHSVSEILE